MSQRVIKAAAVLVAAHFLAACPPPAPGARNASGGSSCSRGAENASSGSSSGGATATARRTGPVSGSVEAPAGATAATPQCGADQPERCDAIDNNCNGTIDEGCGYQGGGIQITASWQGNADIDLRVTDPASEEVYFGHRQSASGGQMDQDANAECTPTRPTVENVRWSGQSPPPGRYEARLVAYDLCGTASANVTLSVAVGGRVVGTYNVNFTYARQEFPFAITVR